MFFLAFAESIQLFPDGTIFIHIALILLMIWVLNRTFFRPVNRIIESRDQLKGGGTSEAENIVGEAEEKESQYRTAVLEARNEGYTLIEQKHSAAVALREQKLSEVKSSVSEQLAAEKAELERQTAAARETLAADADAIADAISDNILRN